MATRRTVDLLPEIFRTDTNRQFLGATLDQLTQEPNLKRTQGYVGRRYGPGVNPADNYVTEPTAVRTDYQLEPGVAFLKPETSTVLDAITYPGMIDALNLQGAQTTRQDALFESEFYSWDPFCDLDKFTNYSQYYWLAQGPDSVDIFGTTVATSDSWDVTRSNSYYEFSDIAGENPTLTLVRGGNYTFNVNQVGFNFWIQAAPGISGKMPGTPNISSRNVLGVTNNGEEQGTVSFNVPNSDAQNFYYNLPNFGTVELVTNLLFTQINGVTVSNFIAAYPQGIDGITDLDGRTVIFSNTVGTPTDLYSVWQIEYVYTDPLNPVIQLNNVQLVSNLTKCNISFGNAYAGTQWYKNASGYFQEVPLLTAVLDTLYYQDSTNPALFGRIKLINQVDDQTINVDEIIGAQNYTSPNGVVFTNGLKVQFRGTSNPPEFQNLEYYVEGVGTGPGIDFRVGFVDGEAYYGPYHLYNGQRITGAVHSTTTFQQYIYSTVAESLLHTGEGAPTGAPLPTTGVPGAFIGNGIKLLPVTDFVTPETYTKSETIPYDFTSYDSTPWDASLNAPLVQDYITINRASQDRNAWSRSNRWFHVDVIRATAEYNNQDLFVDNALRAKRPIIEFRADLNLYNFGTQGKQAVNIVDFNTTDAFSLINGQISYSTDGYNFINGSRVIFAADLDSNVRNNIWQVEFIDPANTGTPVINLIPAADSIVLINQTVVALSGNTQQGKSYWFDGIYWSEAQQKIRVNQPPLFDVFDANGISFSNLAAYPSSTFAGSKLFGYAPGTAATRDIYLGFSLRYLNIDNVGDIVFENFFYTDTFLYVEDNISQTRSISNGLARQYIDRVSFTDLIGWQVAASPNLSAQVFRFVFDGSDLLIDVAANINSIYAPVQIFVEGLFVDPNTYTYTVGENSTTITLPSSIATGTVIEVEVISNQASEVGYYKVPLNLSNNPLNENSNIFTLGTIRTHYESIGQNLQAIQGPIIGANNTRDLGDIIRFGDVIVQHSSPLVLAGTFLRQQQFELFGSIEFNSREYSKYKALLLDLSADGDFVNQTPTEVLDAVLQEITLGRSDISPFYWSDMLPSGEVYETRTITYTVISTPVFDLSTTYDFTSSNYKGLLVYLNGRMLTLNYDYIVSADSPTLTITVPLVPGDVIVIREYPETFGSYVPNTPTKLGLYPAFKPEIYLDTTYVNPTLVIRGHDGSITVAFSDFRDQILLEFETRIFNNLKIASTIPLQLADVVPGQFRTTEYTLAEINNILSEDFLSWVGWNKLDYTTQTYLPTNAFTYNYSQSSNRLTGEPLIGAWRGIYNYFYDTYYPDSRPWEMLGISQKPNWWDSEYGPGPYTSGNTVLWDDLAAGIIRDPAYGLTPLVDPRYIRPQLLEVLPVDSSGQLVDPLIATVGNYDATSFRRSWTFGDDGPVENAWRSSSAWPFAAMRLLALTKPAEFFSLFVDRDRYVYNTELEQYLWDKRYRLNSSELTPLYGSGISKASYLDWIIDYNRQLGINSTDNLTLTLNNIDVRLCWRMAGFSGKNYLKVYTERATPDSQNTSLLLPDESYQLLLYKNQPSARLTYSSVIVQKTDTGYAVLGYSTLDPYFEILVSRPSGAFINLTNNGSTVRVATEHTTNVARVPYGYVFSNVAGVCDFLVSYGALLENQGFVFENRENGFVLNWLQMAQEFLYWNNQGWDIGSIVNLNPAATSISLDRPGVVVDSLNLYSPENIILNQNRQPLKSGDIVIDRIENLFRVSALTSNTINFLNIRYTAYEHLMVLDNRSIFADLIYQPVTGARQSRILVSGWISGDWNGTVNAPGFVLNQDNILEWVNTRKYAKGEIVLFKNEYWSASTIIQPSQAFDYSLWIKSDYNQIQKGLLPNAANVSDQLSTAYSVYDANLESEVDLFSYGLIGFRPRQYMQALNLDDVSQVNLYQQFLGSKGTIRSAELFSLANLGKEVAEYNINEFWAILRSQYGATANRNYVEFLLQESLLHSNPSIVQVSYPHSESSTDIDYDQEIYVQNIWKSSKKITSPDILPTTTTVPTDTGLPVAGYVNLDDVDVTLFDFDAATASGAVALNQVGVNTTVWFAKINDYDWGVFRSELIPGNVISVSDNLDARALVQFNKPHGLSVGDLILINYFDVSINGVYRVLAVTDIQSLLISYVFTGYQTEITGTGIAFTLQTARVAQPADIVNLPYSKQLGPGAKVWVDNNGQGLWEVLEKTEPFTTQKPIGPVSRTENSQYGYAISQGFQNLSALVGAPNFANGGALYTYVKTFADVYEESSILQLGTTGAAGYGNAIDMGDAQWAIVGASASDSDAGYASVIYRNPASSVFDQWQLLYIPPGDAATSTDQFGFTVTMSLDERWIYVGAPGGNRVYTYNRVDVQTQSIRYIATAGETIFTFGNDVVVSDGSQIVVSVNDTLLTYLTDYSVFGNEIILATPTDDGAKVNILRRESLVVLGDGILDNWDISSIYTVTDTESVSVYIDGALQRPVTDYTVTAGILTFTSVPAAGTSISFRAGTYYKLISTLTQGLPSTAQFGFSISTTTSGRKVIVSCLNKQYLDPNGNTLQNTGITFVYDRSVQNFQVTDSSVLSYTPEQSMVSPAVYLNGVYQYNSATYTDGTYSISGNTVTFSIALTIGDIIEIETNEFNLEQSILSQTPGAGNKFGYHVDQCVNDCSLYIGSPYINLTKPQAGQIEVEINQARVFGTITSTIANPTLTPGDFLRVNNYFVEVTGTTVDSLVTDINAAGIPNARATATTNVVLIGDAKTKIFDVGSIYSVAESYTPVVYIGDVLQNLGSDYTYNNTTKQITFSIAPSFESVITVVSGRITISVVNQLSAIPLNKLQVNIGTGTVFTDLGIETYVYQQTITAPVQQDFAYFGEQFFISDNAVTLIASAPNGTPISSVTFDDNTTTFDAESTNFIDTIPQAGVVYTYDALPAVNWSVTNPLKFVFGQQIYNSNGQALDRYGAAVDYTTGTLLVGAPGFDAGDSQVGYGIVTALKNVNKIPAWQRTRVQQPTIDINLLNTVFMYDRVSGLPKQYFDYFNPSQGRLLGAVAQNLDYTGAIDPAAYNIGLVNNYGLHWNEERVGKIWWNTSKARFIDTNQDDIVYDSRRWGQLFPGSTVEVYQWISSSVPPTDYAGPGTPYSLTSYTVTTSLNEQGIVGVLYYFWVTGIDTVSTIAKKTLSINTIAQYIESPKSSGISYLAPINASTFAIYNGSEYISASDTVLHIEYDQQLNDAAVHVQYQLIPQDRADGFLTDSLYNKLQDSFCGVDAVGRLVPDPFLTPSEQYGVQARPRQSMFVNRFAALKNYLKRANDILAQFPISETRRFNLLNSREPEPSRGSNEWDFRVATYEELTFQDLSIVPYGYKYLVASNSNYRGLWTIYEVVAGSLVGSKELSLIRVQNYDTRLYWNYINWNAVGYNPATKLTATVANYSDLATLTNISEGASVGVAANNQGKSEVYQLTNGEWVRVGLQDGTIEFQERLWDYTVETGRYGFDVEVFDAQFFDQEPVIETRKIIQAINQELLIDELLIERNRLLVLMFNYILSEQIAPNWLSKTSLIDVDHTIRELKPYQIYRRDNQDFVLNYIQEVKPYHVQIREFNLIYNRLDTYEGTVNDFDLPAYWDSTQNLFISPILDDTGNLSTTSSVPSTSAVWQTLPWDQWYQNYLLEIESVIVTDSGSGYSTPPEVVVTGTAVVPATMTAVTNTAGEVIRIDVDNPGQGYSTTAIITLVGGNGTGARASAVMGNGLVRNLITTIKYDRYEYQSQITEWQANVSYDNGTLVRFANMVWKANSSDSTAVDSPTFDTTEWIYVPAADLSGVDRTMGYYVPNVNEPGLDLAQLISGVDYPGVQVAAPSFSQNTGFDVGNFDINPYDNIAYGPEGLPTYDPAILDAIYMSNFVDPYLGVLPTSINVDGGQFVDTFSSHAPEELVPGAIFDTLDMRVFTSPGADWEGTGHGFPLTTIKYGYDSTIENYSFSGLVEYPVAVQAWNQTIGIQLLETTDYEIDWVNQTINFVSVVAENDIIIIEAIALGGGNQLYTDFYNGADIGDTIILPIQFNLVESIVVFVNGVNVTAFTASAYNVNYTEIVFATTYTSTDAITVTALGADYNGNDYSWSLPQTQYFTADGSTVSFTLDNSLEGTNPANIIVEKNGIRARPAESVEYIDDGSSLQYYCPDRGGYSPSTVSPNEVAVYVNGQPLVLGVGYVLDPWDGFTPSRTITLSEMPPAGATILISVSTAAQYYITGNTLFWKTGGSLNLLAGDIVTATTFNDTDQQNILTQVFVGPSSQGITVSEGYDSTVYDLATVPDTSGSFDFSTGIQIQTNNFDTGRIIDNPSRLVVSVDGFFIFENSGFSVNGSVVTILGPIISGASVVVITSYTQSIVPGAIAFRIFQDMRGLQSTYRITTETTTALTSALSATDDIIYVVDANALSQPNLPQGIFGLITIDGERIAYRYRDTENNTVSGLRRGTAGTGAADHDVDAPVYDIGIGNLLPVEYQNYVLSQDFLANGTQTVFTTDNITLVDMTQPEIDRAIEVYVGGILQQGGYTILSSGPVSISFTVAPTENYQVTILVKRALSWYEPGATTASNGVALQEQNTTAARFIRGE